MWCVCVCLTVLSHHLLMLDFIPPAWKAFSLSCLSTSFDLIPFSLGCVSSTVMSSTLNPSIRWLSFCLCVQIYVSLSKRGEGRLVKITPNLTKGAGRFDQNKDSLYLSFSLCCPTVWIEWVRLFGLNEWESSRRTERENASRYIRERKFHLDLFVPKR